MATHVEFGYRYENVEAGMNAPVFSAQEVSSLLERIALNDGTGITYKFGLR